MIDSPITLYKLLPYYFIALLYIFLTYIVGKAMRSIIFRIKEPLSAFSILSNVLIGWVTLVTFYTVIMTHGKTVNLLFFVLFTLYLLFRKKNYFNESQVPIIIYNTAIAVLADSGPFHGLLLTVLGSRSDFFD